MLSFLRRIFGGNRRPIDAAVYQAWDRVPDAHHATVRAVFSLEEQHAHDLLLLTRISFRLGALADDENAPRTREEQRLRNFIMKERPGQPQRWLIPASLTEGAGAEYAEFAVPYTCIPQDSSLFEINQGMLPCLAQPGQGGAVKAQPYSWESIEARQAQRIELVLRRGGVIVQAVRVQANHALYEPGTTDLPGLVLFSFDEEAAGDLRYLLRLADQLYDLKTAQPENEAEARAQAIIRASEKQAYYHRREQLPKGFTGGRVVYAADLWFHRTFLPGRHLIQGENRPLRCIAEPGEKGAVEHVAPDGE